MPIDLGRVALAAAQAALNEAADATGEEKNKRRHRLSGGRALLIGAGVMTAGRVIVGSRGNGWLQSLEERLGRGDGEPPDAEDEEEYDEDEAGDEAYERAPAA